MAWSAPSNDLNQCWNIVNSNIRNKFQWNLKRNFYIFIHENEFENVCEMAAILSRPQCVNSSRRRNVFNSVNYTMSGSDNSSSLVRRQVIIWTHAGFLSTRILRTSISDIWIKIQQFSYKKKLKMPFVKWLSFCPDFNVLIEMTGWNWRLHWR